jgi:diaminohydroxyphosphoribosylaminopyrimidine deaminase/5-amino-6-(5-phosphoribosylamino)uracil reductase
LERNVRGGTGGNTVLHIRQQWLGGDFRTERFGSTQVEGQDWKLTDDTVAMSREDEKYIKRCFELARRGKGRVSPNPLVGCVIVRGGTIVSEGYHQRFGGPHAEVVALRKAGTKARGATLYVNLEPCPHHGKTPPCTEAILAAGVKRVVACMKDPNPLVTGSGFAKLRKAGIQVSVGALRREAEELNEKFVTFMKTGFPFVGVKVAQTLDGKIADVVGRSQWITGKEARTYAHQLRTEYDAILVGAGTVLRDNPRLTVRRVKGRSPLRVVLDGKLSVHPSARLFDTRVARTIVLTSVPAMKKYARKVGQLTMRGVDVLSLERSTELDPKGVLAVLGEMEVSSVLIEGGSRTISKFLEAGLVQAVHCFIAPKIFGAGLDAWRLQRGRLLSQSIQLKNLKLNTLGGDLLLEGRIL